MTFDRIIGIDPGIGGAIAWVSYDGKEARVFDTPKAVRTSHNRGYDYISMTQTVRMIADGRKCKCAMELVHAMPGDGTVGAFSFGFGAALWQGIVAAADIEIISVDPRRWAKEVGMEVCRDRRQRKANSRLAAAKFYPRLASLFQRIKDDGRAEALLMAEWLRRKTVMAEEMTFQPGDMEQLKPLTMFEDASRYSGKHGGILKVMDQLKKDKP